MIWELKLLRGKERKQGKGGWESEVRKSRGSHDLELIIV